MYQDSPEELSKSFKLSAEVIKELTIRAIGEANLSEIEQLIFSLRHRLLEDNPGSGLMAPEEIVVKIHQDSGARLSADKAMSVLERAEAEVDRFAWETLEKAMKRFLDWDS